MVFLDDTLGERESHPPPALLRGKSGREDAGAQLARDAGAVVGHAQPHGAPLRVQAISTEVLVDLALDGDRLVSTTSIAGTLVCRRSGMLPAEVRSVWAALQVGPELAGSASWTPEIIFPPESRAW